MNIEINLYYDVSRPKQAQVRKPRFDGTEDACHPLRQIGDIWNNIVRYRGVFPTLAEAKRAASEYWRAP